MKLTEALYIAFCVGKRGSVKRNSWEVEKNTRYVSIDAVCNPIDETDDNLYLKMSNKRFSYIRLDDKFMNTIKDNLRKKPVFNYRLDITEEDVKADDWRVDNLTYIDKEELYNVANI